jgi:hypothetical protein
MPRGGTFHVAEVPALGTAVAAPYHPQHGNQVA